MRFLIVSFLSITPCFCSVLTFTDLTTWTQAAAGLSNVVVLQGFGTPGLGIVTESGPDSAYNGLGHLDGDTWTDTVGKNAGGVYIYDFTTITYTAGALYGIFGTWDVQPSYSSGLQITGQGAGNQGFMLTPFGGDPTGNADNRDGFVGTWGFLSDLPLSQIVFASGKGSVSFTLSGPEWADPPFTSTPEPVTLALMGIGLLGIYCYGRGRSKRTTKAHQAVRRITRNS